jgi:hypothetical protein
MNFDSFDFQRHYPDEFFEKFLPMEISQSDCKVPGGGKPENFPFIAKASESDFGVGNGQYLDLSDQIGAFGLFTAKELPSGGNIEEKICHLNAGSRSLPGVPDFMDPAAAYLNGCSYLFILAPG